MKRYLLIAAIVLGAGGVLAAAGMTNLTGLDIKPAGYQTNSLVVRNNTGTAMLTVAKAGTITYAGAQTFDAGVTYGAASSIDYNGVNADWDPTGTWTVDMDAAKVCTYTVADNLASAWEVQEATSTYIDVTTTNSSEAITFGNTTTNPYYIFLGSGRVEVDGELELDGALDADSTSNFADTATFSKGSGTALDVSTGGELNIDGTLDCNGNADFAGNAVFSGTSKTISFASALDANAGADVGGAALNCSYTGNALTAPNGSDMEWQGFVSIGNGTPDGLTDGTDDALYVENSFEVDGTAYFDGAIDADAGANIGGAALTLSYTGDALVMGAGIDASLDGYVAHGTGTPDKLAAGTDAALYVTDAFEVDGLAYLDGAAQCASTLGVTGAATFSAAAEFNGAIYHDNIATKIAAYDASAATTDGILLMNTAAGAMTYTIPDEDCDAAADVGRIVIVKCIGSCGSKNLTIDPEGGGQTIDGAATMTIGTNYGSVNLLCGAVDAWYVF